MLRASHRRLTPLRLLGLGLLASLVHCGASADDVGSNGSDVGADVPGAKECADALLAIPPEAWHREGRIDPDHQDAVLHATRECLTRYTRLNTSNPRIGDEPGEAVAADFLKQVFARLDIPTRTAPLARHPDPKRASMVATLKGTTNQKSIILLNHEDVVRADATAWSHDPFGGEDDGQFIWGRGTLDMKGTGVMQLVAMAVLKRAGVQLQRDTHFVAVADEEEDGLGSEYIALTAMNGKDNVKVDPLGLNPGVVLNEGGTGIKDDLLQGRDVFLVGTEEKGLVWTQLADQDPKELIRAIVRSTIIDPPSSKGFSASSAQTALKSACKLAGLETDGVQKTNVQPRTATVTLDCAAGSKAAVESALSKTPSAFTPAPTLTITSAANGARETVTIDIAEGNGGHGAATGITNALHVAASVLVSTGQLDASTLTGDSSAHDHFFKYAISPANHELLTTLARTYGETASDLAGALPNFIGQNTVIGAIAPYLPTDAIFRNTCNWTAFKYPVAGEARAKFDCRMSFDAKADAFEQQFAAYFASQGAIALRTNEADCADCDRQDFNTSSFDGSANEYQTIKYLVERASPDAIVSPYMFPGSSDTYFYRREGVPTYGLLAASVHQDVLETFHGLNERFPVDQLFGAVQIYAETIYRLGNGTGRPAADAAHQLKAPQVSCERRKKDLFDSSYSWTPVEGDTLVCGDTATLYRCKVADGAPRFLRVLPSENDIRLYEVDRLKKGGGDDASVELPAAADVDKVLYKSRDTSSDPSTRVFADQEFEIDTGAGSDREFTLRCSTPTSQYIATAFTQTKVRFYAE
jgi:acetylornithine deacetylase/succinyl-diaminopimelate desuccinylase-like protein